MRLLRFENQRNQSVNYFSKVYIVHFVFLGKCTTACKSKVADVLYILFLLGTLAIGNTGPGPGPGEIIFFSPGPGPAHV